MVNPKEDSESVMTEYYISMSLAQEAALNIAINHFFDKLKNLVAGVCLTFLGIISLVYYFGDKDSTDGRSGLYTNSMSISKYTKRWINTTIKQRWSTYPW